MIEEAIGAVRALFAPRFRGIDAKLAANASDIVRLQGPVVFSKSGATLQVRVPWDGTNDFATQFNMGVDTGNYAFEFLQSLLIPKASAKTVVTGAQFKSMSDDICPVLINGSYMGGNHGFDAGYTVAMAAHGKTEADIGSVWTSANGSDYVLLKVPSANTLLFCSEYTGVETAPLLKVTLTSPLTHKAGAAHTESIVFSDVSARTQIKPCVNNVAYKVLVNGVFEWDLSLDGWVNCEFVDAVVGYNILHIPSMLTALKADVGTNTNASLFDDSITEKYCRVTFVYRFTRNGAVMVIPTYDFDRSVSLDRMALVQSGTIGTKMYVPDTAAYAGVTVQPAADTHFYDEGWASAEKIPYRYYQFNADLSKGMCLGFCPSIGHGVNAKRALLNTTDAGYFGSNYKMYPYLICGKTLSAGTLIGAVAYMIPLRVIDADFSAVCWYWVGDDIYLMIDAHKTITKRIALPDYMVGRKVAPIDVHANATVYQDIVGAEGLKIGIANDYGYAVLKLTR